MQFRIEGKTEPRYSPLRTRSFSFYAYSAPLRMHEIHEMDLQNIPGLNVGNVECTVSRKPEAKHDNYHTLKNISPLVDDRPSDSFSLSCGEYVVRNTNMPLRQLSFEGKLISRSAAIFRKVPLRFLQVLARKQH